jgi:hypothetical protein
VRFSQAKDRFGAGAAPLGRVVETEREGGEQGMPFFFLFVCLFVVFFVLFSFILWFFGFGFAKDTSVSHRLIPILIKYIYILHIY